MEPHGNIAGAHVIFHRLLPVGVKRKIPAVLLCKRTQDAPVHAGHWGLFGGTIDRNDASPEDAAKREAREELSVCHDDQCQAVNVALTGLAEFTDVLVARADGKSIIRYFCCELDFDMAQLTLRANFEGKVEGEGLGWFTAEEVHHLVARPEDRIAIEKFFGTHGT